MAKEDGGYAFPRGYYHPNGNGMTLRDWLAGQALAGSEISSIDDAYAAAKHAYRIADAMLAERDK